MKTRLFEIVYLLLLKKKLTAKELAERFEVSQRTIYRDIEALCQAGIPVTTDRGLGGGIALMDTFVLDSAVLSGRERNEIISALQGLRSVKDPDAGRVLDKLSAIFGIGKQDWINVDFTGWGMEQKDRFSCIKRAVINKLVIEFGYYSSYGEFTQRAAEPLQLWFKDRAWYLVAFCRAKKDVRLFKLSRMRDVRVKDEAFERRMPLGFKASLEPPGAGLLTMKLKIDASQAYRVYDEFEGEGIEKFPDGGFIVTVTYPAGEWVIGYILSFGCHAEVLSPAELRDEIKVRLKKTLELYN